jgi:hypothetical protein
MSSYDKDSYNQNSFSILSYDFGEIWKSTKRFSLRVVTATRVVLGVRV